MIKLVFCVRRLPSVPPEEFFRYWREEHGPLVASVAEPLHIVRYVQSHTEFGPGTDAVRASRGAAEPYDGLAEVWFDEAALAAPTPEFVAAGMQLAEDEARFIDLPHSSLFLTREHVVVG